MEEGELTEDSNPAQTTKCRRKCVRKGDRICYSDIEGMDILKKIPEDEIFSTKSDDTEPNVNIDSIHSGESLFKSFSFDVKEDSPDMVKCMAFWKSVLEKNLSPVKCTLWEKKKKKEEKNEEASVNTETLKQLEATHNQLWVNAFKEIQRKKLDELVGRKQKCDVCEIPDTDEVGLEMKKREEKEDIEKLNAWDSKKEVSHRKISISRVMSKPFRNTSQNDKEKRHTERTYSAKSDVKKQELKEISEDVTPADKNSSSTKEIIEIGDALKSSITNKEQEIKKEKSQLQTINEQEEKDKGMSQLEIINKQQEKEKKISQLDIVNKQGEKDKGESHLNEQVKEETEKETAAEDKIAKQELLQTTRCDCSCGLDQCICEIIELPCVCGCNLSDCICKKLTEKCKCGCDICGCICEDVAKTNCCSCGCGLEDCICEKALAMIGKKCLCGKPNCQCDNLAILGERYQREEEQKRLAEQKLKEELAKNVTVATQSDTWPLPVVREVKDGVYCVICGHFNCYCKLKK